MNFKARRQNARPQCFLECAETGDRLGFLSHTNSLKALLNEICMICGERVIDGEAAGV